MAIPKFIPTDPFHKEAAWLVQLPLNSITKTTYDQ